MVMMFEVEPTMVRIGEGLKLSQRGERDAARGLFTQIWLDIGQEGGDAIHRCALAHATAARQYRLDQVELLRYYLHALDVRLQPAHRFLATADSVVSR